MTSSSQRSTEEIRQSIEQARGELVRSVSDLRFGVSRLTDWRYQAREHKAVVAVGATVVGLGLAAIGRGFLRRRRG